MNITESRAAISSTELESIECELGISLPGPYRAFVLQHNGGHPELCAFEHSSVNRFLSFARGGRSDFVDYFNLYKGDPRRMSQDLVPIASDPFGNLICISVSGARSGQIVFWDHEHESASNNENEHLVSESFEMFLRSLTPLPEVEDSEIPPDVLKLLEEED